MATIVEAEKLPASHAQDLIQKVLLAGAANASASICTNPFDLIKVRQQLSERRAGTAGNNAFKLAGNMLRTEGPLAFYKGLSASMMREMTYSGLRMGLYDPVKHALPTSLQSGIAAKLTAGMVSGVIGAAIANPFDLMKVRMQAAGNTMTLPQHFRSIHINSGYRGFYRAVGATMTRAGILTATQLGTYDHAKQVITTRTGRDDMTTHAMASAMAGFACSAASAPVDVIKVRIMKDSQYSSPILCATDILRKEGPFAFYKGFTMCFVRLWPHTVISLLLLEKFRELAGLKPVGQK